MKSITLFILLLILPLPVANAGLNESVPTYHWSYEYIDQLWLRGYFQTLNILNRPYTRGEIAEAISTHKQEIERGVRDINQQEHWLFHHLEEEFQVEILELYQRSQQTRFQLGSYFTEDLNIKSDDLIDQTRVRSRFSFSPGSNLTIVNNLVFDNRLDDNPNYIGKRRYNVAGFTEQAYIRLNWHRFDFTLGREFVRWGTGENSTLHISDSARPLDMIRFSFGQQKIKFTFFAAMLDGVEEEIQLNDNAQIVFSNRFMSAHRLDLTITSWLRIALTESILYGGANRSFELAYLNPFLFYHGNLLNGPGEGNTIGSFDWYLTPVANMGFFGTFMIDDIQLDNKSVDDFEPDELGWNLGLKVADLFSLNGSNILIEYTRISNRTYNSIQPHEKYLHRNFPIGHSLGNDFDLWQVQAQQWLRRDIEISVEYEHRRKGSGDIRALFDTPWSEATMEQGYSEPFPTGIVETSQVFKFGVFYHPFRQFKLSITAQFQSVTNMSHILSSDRRIWGMQFKIWWAPEFNIELH